MSEAPGKPSTPIGLVVDPPLSRKQVVGVSLVGFGLLVALVLLAGFLGYQGSNAIQDAAQSLTREHALATGRGLVLQGKIEAATQNLIDKLAWVLGLCFLLAIGTAVVTLRIIQKGFSQLESQSSELAHVSWHMLDMQEKLARRFSHEMHDELGQSLSGLRRLLSGVPEGQYGAIRSECVGICDEVLQSVRKLSQVLRPVILDDFGLDSSLRWLCDRFNQRTRIEMEYVSNFSGRLSESLETQLFRITQEALTNIARHSHATNVCVSLAASRNSIRLTIDDNGRGLEPQSVEPAPSLGMVGMKARARQIHGELRVVNRKEGGLRVEVEAPLQEAVADVEREDPSFVG